MTVLLKKLYVFIEHFDGRKWTVHFLDNLRCVVVHNQSYWHLYKRVGFKDLERENPS